MKLGVKRRFLNLLFPPKCILCEVIIDAQREDICPECRRSLPWAGTAVKQGGYHEGVISAFRYEGSVREAFLRYKFQGQYWLADVFGQLLAQTVAAQLEGRFDLITWAPVSKKRKRQRTYDQAELLAKSAGLALDTPAAQCLIKTRHTKPNSSLDDLKEKQRNVEGVYEALPGMGGRRILLIDDVCTTGSTLSECAKTLMLGGAKSVICATFARTGD